MNTNDLLTVKEFAAAAGVTEQAIYKRLNNPSDQLNNYLTLVEGRKRLDKAALSLFTQPTTQPVEQPVVKPLNQVEQPVEQPRVETLQQSVIDTQAAEIETLKQQLETLQTELTAKNTQISLLQAHTAGQQKTIDSLTAALTAAQTLQAMEKQERLQLQGDTQPGGDQSEAGTASAPKRGIFARIREAWSKPPRG
jgi:hypothetical protein